MTQEERQKDEKIRKALVKLFQDCGDTDIEFCNTGFSYQEIFAWLEKQGESIDVDSILNKVGVKCAYKDGNAWCILYGDNIQDGVCGFGYTKEEALIEFLKDLLEKQGKPNPSTDQVDIETVELYED